MANPAKLEKIIADNSYTTGIGSNIFFAHPGTFTAKPVVNHADDTTTYIETITPTGAFTAATNKGFISIPVDDQTAEIDIQTSQDVNRAISTTFKFRQKTSIEALGMFKSVPVGTELVAIAPKREIGKSVAMGFQEGFHLKVNSWTVVEKSKEAYIDCELVMHDSFYIYEGAIPKETTA